MFTQRSQIREPHGLSPRVAILLACVVIATVVIYLPALNYPFTQWDDHHYVVDDTSLQAFDLDQIKVEFSRYVVGNYHPITMLSYCVDILFFGKDPHAMHATNLLIHVVNMILVFLILYRLTGDQRIALIAVILFTMHPTRVESVAWISARKDVLMLFFTLLCMLAWLAWCRSGRSIHYVLALLMFAMACLSKAMAVALVPTLFLLDWYQGRSWRTLRAWLEKVPFIVSALIVGLVAIKAQGDAIVEGQHTLLQRLVIALANLAIYFVQQFVPIGLSARYSYPHHSGAGLPWHYVALAACTLILLVLLFRIRKFRTPMLALLIFIVNVALVLQFLPVGNAVRADRYMYVAGVGWALLVAWLLERLYQRGGVVKGAVLPFVLAYGLALGYLSHQRVPVWADTLSIWNDILTTDPHAVDILLRRSSILQARGRYAEALPDLDNAVAFAPPGVTAPSFHRGLLHLRLGDPAAALHDLDKVYRTGERPLGLEANLTYAKFKLARCEDVISHANDALERDPDAIDFLNMRAYCLLRSGSDDKARADVAHSLELKSDYGDIWHLAAMGEFARRDTARACAHWARSEAYAMGDPDLKMERDSLLLRSCR